MDLNKVEGEADESRISQAFNDVIDDTQRISETMAPSMTGTGSGTSGDPPLATTIDDRGGNNDGPTLREAQEYADDLARELINNNTDQLVRDEQEAIEKSKGDGEAISIKQEIISVDTTSHEDHKEDQNIAQIKRTSFVVGHATMYFDQDSLDMGQAKDNYLDGSDIMKFDSPIISTVNKDNNGDAEQKTETSKGEEINVKSVPTMASSVNVGSTTELEKEEKGGENTKNVTELDIDAKHEVKIKEKAMEFSKNYSDDLLMGSTGEQRQHQHQQDQQNQGDGHDLADFELPQCSGSSGSSACEQAQGPASTLDNVASSSSPSSSDLTAIKNILISSYSKFSHVFHWKKPIESGIFLGIGLTLITALTFFSIISVVAYSALGIMLSSALMRIYKASMKALSRSQETPMDHIWEKVLNSSIKVSPEKIHKLVDASQGNFNASLVYFKQVLLVEDKLATCKFALFLYMLTYIGAWFNGLTLITITYLSLFTIPLFYEKNKTKIDEHIKMATNQITSALSLVTNKTSALIFGSQSLDASKKQN